MKKNKALLMGVLGVAVALGVVFGVRSCVQGESNPGDINAWYGETEPSIWISGDTVWLSTPDLGVVDAGKPSDALANYPQFGGYLQKAIGEFGARHGYSRVRISREPDGLYSVEYEEADK